MTLARSSAPSHTPWCWLAVGGALLVQSLVAYWLPVIQDEAYYYSWGKTLDLGYLDHPPIIAWLTHSDVTSPWAVRGFVVVCSLLQCCVNYALFRKLGLRDISLALAVLLGQANLAGLLVGVLATPDVVLALAWSIVLHEACVALRGARHRWLSAGAVAGIGMLSKYTMLLIGPVCLIGLWLGDRRGLRTPWPYLGVGVTLLVLLPHLNWNQDNGWVTFKFQLRHGFSLAQEHINRTGLPEPLPAEIDTAEYRLARQLFEPKEERPRRQRHFVEKALGRVGDFFGGQLALWGFLIPLGWVLWRRRLRWSEVPWQSGSDATLMAAAVVVPLGTFGLISIGSKIEANWGAMYAIGACAWLGAQFRGAERWVVGGAWANILALVVITVHAHRPLLPVKPKNDRILQETWGYGELADFVGGGDRIIFADSYQLVSMLRFYGLTGVQQWPGVTRGSEFTRRREWAVPAQSPWSAHSMTLITTDIIPPRISGFTCVRMQRIRDCLDRLEVLTVTEDGIARSNAEDCNRFVHTWFVNEYRNDQLTSRRHPG